MHIVLLMPPEDISQLELSSCKISLYYDKHKGQNEINELPKTIIYKNKRQ